MTNTLNRILLFASLTLLYACSAKEEDRIIGKWQADQDWFRFKQDKTYDGGRTIVTLVSGYRYAIDPVAKELILYTDKEYQTYYLQYQLQGNDTLRVKNKLDKIDHWVIYTRQTDDKQKP